MTGMDLGPQPSYPAAMTSFAPSRRDRTTAGFPQSRVPPRALARLR